MAAALLSSATAVVCVAGRERRVLGGVMTLASSPAPPHPRSLVSETSELGDSLATNRLEGGGGGGGGGGGERATPRRGC